MLLLGGLLGMDGLHVPLCAGVTPLHVAPPSLLVHWVELVHALHVHVPPVHGTLLESTHSSPPPQSVLDLQLLVHVPCVMPPQLCEPPHCVLLEQLEAVQTPLLQTPLAHCELAVQTQTLLVQLPPPHWLFLVHAFMPHVPSWAPWQVYDVLAQSLAE